MSELSENPRNAPQVSVVIPCYNAEKWIGRAIDSVLLQRDVSVDLIVIDDGSTDGSLDVIRQYADRICLEVRENQGACAARNRGLEIVRTKYVMFLDADDYLEGPFLHSAVAAIGTKGAEIAFGPIYTEDAGTRRSFEIDSCETGFQAMRCFLNDGFIPPCGTVWSVSLLRSIGGWSEGLRRYQDYEMTFRGLSKNPTVAVFRDGAGIYFQHSSPDRISLRSDIETIYDQVRVIRFVRSCLYQVGFSDYEIEVLMRCRAYRFWRQTCRHSNFEIRDIGRQLYKEVGGKGHKGSPMHRLTASILGLPTKERVSLYVAAAKRKVRGKLISFFIGTSLN